MIKLKKKDSRFTLRQRVHYWFCDRFNIVSYDDFVDLMSLLDKKFLSIDHFARSQAELDRKMVERLSLQYEFDEGKSKNDKAVRDSYERGVY